MSVLVIGESCVDVFQYGDCKRLCPEAPVPVFNPTRKIENGGMAYNVYRNLQSLEIKCDIHTNENYEQIKKTRFIDEKTNHMFMRLDENDLNFNRCDLNKINFSLYDAIIISDYNKGFLSDEDINFIGKSHNVVFLDTKKILSDWCKSVSYIKINLDEYERTKHMLDNEIYNKLIITMGASGAKHNNITYSVKKVEIKDTSGAGDTFVAGCVAEFLKSKDITKSINFANDCATMVVQKKGVSVI
jgi:bifunctional ADP-heptose synthase (sugar kinase/adenylyltransferase)